jgi:hypothetical protein
MQKTAHREGAPVGQRTAWRFISNPSLFNSILLLILEASLLSFGLDGLYLRTHSATSDRR